MVPLSTLCTITAVARLGLNIAYISRQLLCILYLSGDAKVWERIDQIKYKSYTFITGNGLTKRWRWYGEIRERISQRSDKISKILEEQSRIP